MEISQIIYICEKKYGKICKKYYIYISHGTYFTSIFPDCQ